MKLSGTSLEQLKSKTNSFLIFGLYFNIGGFQMPFLEFLKEIKTLISQLPNKSSSGHDHISNKLLKGIDAVIHS